MVRTQIQLTEEQMAQLRKLAAEERVSLAALIRRSVDLLLEARRDPADDRARRALEVVGRFRSGKQDIAVEHDAYLGEAFR